MKAALQKVNCCLVTSVQNKNTIVTPVGGIVKLGTPIMVLEAGGPQGHVPPRFFEEGVQGGTML